MKNYQHLLKLGEQARARIEDGEPRTNLVRSVDGVLSEGEPWEYPHSSDLFSLDEASFWTSKRIAEYAQIDRDHAEAMTRLAVEKAAIYREQARRGAMTDLEREVEDAILLSPQFLAFSRRHVQTSLK